MEFSLYSGFRWLFCPIKLGVSLRDPKIFVICHDTGVDFYDSIDDFTTNLNIFLKEHCSKDVKS